MEEVETHVINSSVLSSGTLIYDEEVNLTTEVIGRVTGVFVEEADTVTQGQLLLQIDDETFSRKQSSRQAAVRMRKLPSKVSVCVWRDCNSNGNGRATCLTEECWIRKALIT